MRRKKGANRRDPPIVGRTKLSHGERSFQGGTVYPFPARHRYCFSEIILTTYFTSNVVLNFFWVKISEFCFLLFCQVRFIKNRQSLFFFWSWKKKKQTKPIAQNFAWWDKRRNNVVFFLQKYQKVCSASVRRRLGLQSTVTGLIFWKPFFHWPKK